MSDVIRWGILGAGNIAGRFAPDLRLLKDAELVAVACRSEDKARGFASRFGARRSYGSYDQLAQDPEIDVVYVATPHSLHYDNTIACINAGKAVLCEKPLAVNAEQAGRMIEAAQKAGVFLMEGMWVRFFPMMAQLRQWLSNGAIGKVQMLQSDFGFSMQFDPQHRAFNPDLAGGALLDVGVYPVSLASMVFGAQPERISSMAHLGQTGVDERSAMIFGYEDGQLATLSCAVSAKTFCEINISGEKGHIRIHSHCWRPEAATIAIDGVEPRTVKLPFEDNGFVYEAAEVTRCIQRGEKQSRIMPLAESLRIMETMDTIRSQWSMKYPME